MKVIILVVQGREIEQVVVKFKNWIKLCKSNRQICQKYAN